MRDVACATQYSMDIISCGCWIVTSTTPRELGCYVDNSSLSVIYFEAARYFVTKNQDYSARPLLCIFNLPYASLVSIYYHVVEYDSRFPGKRHTLYSESLWGN